MKKYVTLLCILSFMVPALQAMEAELTPSEPIQAGINSSAAASEQSHFNPKVLLTLGEACYSARCGKQDFSLARQLFTKVANQYHDLEAQARASRYLAQIFLCGQGIDKDLVKARELFEEVAYQQDDPEEQEIAAFQLSRMLFFGEGGSRDSIRSQELLTKLTTAKDPEVRKLSRQLLTKMKALEEQLYQHRTKHKRRLHKKK